MRPLNGFQFKLANLSPNSVSHTIFHNKRLSGPARRKNNKTCDKNCNIFKADIKIHSRIISDEIITGHTGKRTLSHLHG